jgi:hypothetical protein
VAPDDLNGDWASLEQETQQKILNALNQAFSELSDWLRGLGLPEAEVSSLFSKAMAENGLFARFLLNAASNVISVNGEVNVQASEVEHALAWAKSGEFASWLLSQPEPTREQLDQILPALKNVLPNLRQRVASSAKYGPRRKRGGRRKELPDPGDREKIRESIKNLRGPGVRLQDLYQRLADRHGVSPTTIKRIWAEGSPSVEGEK